MTQFEIVEKRNATEGTHYLVCERLRSGELVWLRGYETYEQATVEVERLEAHVRQGRAQADLFFDLVRRGTLDVTKALADQAGQDR